MEESEARTRLEHTVSPIEVILINRWLALRSMKKLYNHDCNKEIAEIEKAIKEFDELINEEKSE
jgi:hypothetical protein